MNTNGEISEIKYFRKARSLVSLRNFYQGFFYEFLPRNTFITLRKVNLQINFGMMDCQSNSFENLIQFFKSICSALEANAESDLMDIEKQCKEEFFESEKTLERFDELTSGISETCKEVLNRSEILNLLTKRTISEVSAINVPYEIHSDLVNSIRTLYNMSVPGTGADDEKLINERNKQLINYLFKECEKNICDTKDIHSALIDAKATFKYS